MTEEGEALRDFTEIIDAVDEPRYMSFTCKRLNCRIRLCSLRPEAEIEIMDAFTEWQMSAKRTHKSLRSIKVKTISKSVVDQNGTRIYDTSKGRELLGRKLDSASVEQIADQVLKHSGLDNLKGELDEGIEDAKKN